jgi:hypothetical protein
MSEVEKKPFRIRVRDVIIRIAVRIGKMVTCNKIMIKSSCCERNITTYVEDNHMSIHTYSTKEQDQLIKED